VLWIAFISIVFCLPELAPVNSQTLNYAPVAVGIVLTYALGFWAVSARRWFAGPIKQIAGKLRAQWPPLLLLSMCVCLDRVNADERSFRTEEEMDTGVAELAVMSEKAETVQKSTDS
jgi:hypothetical protein